MYTDPTGYVLEPVTLTFTIATLSGLTYVAVNVMGVTKPSFPQILPRTLQLGLRCH